MRKIIAAMLIFVTLFSALSLSSIDVYSAPKNTKKANPSTANVLIDGKKVRFESYNIENAYCFKLRDIAMALKGTEKSFEVGTDAVSKEIKITTKAKYTPVGGELSVPAKENSKDATPTTSTLLIDGSKRTFAAYNIGGKIYYKLFDLSGVIGFNVSWIEKTKTLEIITVKNQPNGKGTNNPPTPDVATWPKIPNPNVVIPKLSLVGNFPPGNDKIIKAWETYYPYFYKYLGRPTNFETKGIQFVWNPNIIAENVTSYVSRNEVETGPQRLHTPTEPYEDPNNPLYFHMMHEFGHMFFQYDGKLIGFDFGQWIWEAHSLIAQSLTRSELYNESPHLDSYDIRANIGWDGLNGVHSDGNKYNRSFVDESATLALRMLTEVLSYDSNFDFIKRVNEGNQKQAQESNDSTISADEYKQILNEAAGGRLIDGKKAGDWLFEQPVSNIKGKKGNFVVVLPSHATSNAGDTPRFIIAAFERYEDERGGLIERPLRNQTVTIDITDQNGKPFGKTEVLTDGSGMKEFYCNLSTKLSEGVYRVDARTNVGGNEISGHNVFAVFPKDTSFIRGVDDRMVILPLDAAGNPLKADAAAKINVKGAVTRNMVSNIIMITAKPGANVELSYGKFKTVFSKPVGGRVIPVRLY